MRSREVERTYLTTLAVVVKPKKFQELQVRKHSRLRMGLLVSAIAISITKNPSIGFREKV